MWSWDFTFKILPQLLDTLWITISATIAAFAVAMIGGLILAFARRSTFRLLSWVTYAFIEFIRTTPPLVQLYVIFYVLPRYGLSLSPFTAGVIGLGIHYSTYLSEVYRAGIDSVPRGQWEAATALNFSPLQKWKTIILPQAIRPVVPVMGNYLIVMLKETPMLSAITLVELLGRAQIIGSNTFRYLEPITLVGLFFLVLSYSASRLVIRLEKRMNINHHGKMDAAA
ncbi:ectoine/hydroxyectoine ABC transporter permease subunit EhuD [Marinithermofilum abyssi]|uniref:Ectoine/hydroxyectoine ABC transporter permease subunit EhuD n=1 Tax=Marinithermofilum abyssi TaxID=1571185 RepID=A0A8J2YAG9_9BACL|nr:ectoine/hydroxyectoine ABC transporter permease subunit EhuD [Marinithermofilum abyssi]GGE13701.1 ectoine/hydroxyectoine ABC transporter permease subunit EhuD [Marinithermofilum abyssi]